MKKENLILEIKNLIQSQNLNIDLNLPDKELIQQFQDKVDWVYISINQKLSESFIEKFKDKVEWNYISESQKLSEKFIEKFQDKVDWVYISINQKLSESFIEKFHDKVSWVWISMNQKLSESFIEKFKDKVNWGWISSSQKLSEEFIEKFQDKVEWHRISICQKLSESFIEKFQDKVSWVYISIKQKLSESFIEKFQDKIEWIYIIAYQKLSEEFIDKHNLNISDKNMLYYSKDKKLEILNSAEEGNPYQMEGDYIIAFKSTKLDGYSTYNFQYQYLVGETYESHADGNLNANNSFGLSAWTKEEALDYKSNGELYKVKVHIDDVVAIVHEKKKLRCTKIQILEKINLS